MENVKLRRVKVAEVSKLSTIAKQTFYETFTGTCTPADMAHFLDLYYNENTLAAELEDEAMCCYFAEVDEQIAGYCLFAENSHSTIETLKNKKSIELKRLYVLPQYQGVGVAQQLMDFYLSTAAKQHFEFAFLGVWEYNYKAQYFYKKYGFLPTEHVHAFPIGSTPQTDVYFIKPM